MRTINAAPAGTRNRNVAEFSFPAVEEKRRDSLIRLAWVNIVAGFRCRPSPRGPWDETATGDQTPWKYVVAPIRSALASAIVMGDRQLIEQTLEGARAFCRELEADFASMVPQAEEESIVSVALAETEYEGPANEVQMALVAHPTPVNADRAIIPLERQYERLGALIKRCRRAARQAPASMAGFAAVKPMSWALAGRMTVWTLLALAVMCLIAVAIGQLMARVSYDYPEPTEPEDQDYEEGTSPPRAA